MKQLQPEGRPPVGMGAGINSGLGIWGGGGGGGGGEKWGQQNVSHTTCLETVCPLPPVSKVSVKNMDASY